MNIAKKTNLPLPILVKANVQEEFVGKKQTYQEFISERLKKNKEFDKQNKLKREQNAKTRL
jgi:hypothetical protein